MNKTLLIATIVYCFSALIVSFIMLTQAWEHMRKRQRLEEENRALRNKWLNEALEAQIRQGEKEGSNGNND